MEVGRGGGWADGGGRGEGRERERYAHFSPNKLFNLINRNEFHFSDVYRSVNYIGSRAK